MIDKHTETFIQESCELLEVLEASLLELETDKRSEELIGKIFRALHTIKGAGGMFGFDNIALFVHNIETVYERIRNGEIEVTDTLIDLTLSACDVLKLMLNNDKPGDAEIIASEFKKFLPQEDIKKLAGESDINPIKTENKCVFHIRLEPSHDLFLKGVRPEGLLKELSELGSAVIIPDVEKIPELNELNPELLYVSWDLFLSTDLGLNAIKDVFIFVEDDCTIKIEKIDSGELKGGFEFYSKFTAEEKNNLNLSDQAVVGELSAIKAKPNESVTEIKEKSKNKLSPESISSIRVNSDKLDILVNLVGELVTVQARLFEISNKHNIPELTTISEDVERLTWELRDNTLGIRMLPIGSIFNKFNRLVRDLSKELNKEVELITDGGETELDKNVLEQLNDPLVHIIRNCIDHGIEKPEERIIKNKLRSGSICLSAVHSGTHVLIIISDDGRGLNKEKIYQKAVEKGLISNDTVLSDQEIYNLIFKPGFSTAEKVTNVSGRGVGMDVVLTAIDKLRGSVEVSSKVDEGTTITLKLPITLAIIEGLIVRVGEDYFVLPLYSVEECIELTDKIRSNGKGRNIINVRGKVVPYIPLRERFKILSERPAIEQIVVINDNNTKAGIVVDEIIGEHQTVIKSLGKYYKNIEVLSGATILGNGYVALIIDVEKILKAELEEELLFNKRHYHLNN